MKARTQVVLASIAGAFCLYCAPQAVDSVVERTPVREAMAEEEARCCRPPAQRFVKLGEWHTPAGAEYDDWVTTDAIDVSAYREIVVYTHEAPETGFACGARFRAVYRPDGDTIFGSITAWPGIDSPLGRQPVDGTAAKFAFSQSSTPCPHEVTFVVAGVSP